MTTSTLRTLAKLFASKLILQLENDKYLTREFMNCQKKVIQSAMQIGSFEPKFGIKGV
jgi:hypothetical protein